MVSREPSGTHRTDSLNAIRLDGPELVSLESLAEELDVEGIERPAERAYQGIRRAILRGALTSGSHLGEEALAAMTGTSRTPVREALRRLVNEGLARAESRHRYVANFSFEEVTIIFDVRARLESYGARVAAGTILPGELDDLERIIGAIDELDADAEIAPPARINRYVQLNTRFHANIIKATKSIQMQSLSAQAVSLPLELIKQFVWDQQVNIPRSNDQHRDILAALKAHDPEWAESAMAGHILSTRPRRKPAGSVT